MTELEHIRKDLREIKKAISGRGNTLIEEPINEIAACEFLGVSKRTLCNYVSRGKLKGAYIINRVGQRMYFKSKLITP